MALAASRRTRPCYDLVVLIDQDGITEAKRRDGSCHFAHMRGVDLPQLAKLKTIYVRPPALLVGKDQLVPGAIEAAHSPIVLDPHNQV
jgi:hypothetical protein